MANEKLRPEQRRANPIGSDPRKERRRERAAERKLARDARSVLEQLAVIEGRRGKSARERERLS